MQEIIRTFWSCVYPAEVRWPPKHSTSVMHNVNTTRWLAAIYMVRSCEEYWPAMHQWFSSDNNGLWWTPTACFDVIKENKWEEE